MLGLAESTLARQLSDFNDRKFAVVISTLAPGAGPIIQSGALIDLPAEATWLGARKAGRAAPPGGPGGRCKLIRAVTILASERIRRQRPELRRGRLLIMFSCT